MKKKRYLNCIVLLIVLAFILFPTGVVHAGGLVAWANFFTLNRVGLVNDHFRLWTYSGKVPHINSNTATYSYGDTDARNIITSTIVNNAANYWGSNLTMQYTSVNSHIVLRYDNNPAVTDTYAHADPKTAGMDSNGHILANSTAEMVFFRPILGRTTAQKTNTTAHELGHFMGLGDVYSYTKTTDTLMGYARHSLTAATRQDYNGLYITKGNPWYKHSSGSWRYWASPGVYASGWQQISGKWYYFNPGTLNMVTGWVQVSGNWYCMDSSGAMVTGWFKNTDGFWYYLRTAANIPISGPSGAMCTGWINVGGYWYYLNTATNTPASGRSQGAMLSSGTWTINGKAYQFDASGKCLNP